MHTAGDAITSIITNKPPSEDCVIKRIRPINHKLQYVAGRNKSNNRNTTGLHISSPAPPLHHNLTRHSRGPHRAPESSKSSSQPTTLILGDSIIKNAVVRSKTTSCFPAPTVHDIADKAPEVLSSLPSVDIVHIGTNNICNQQSEILKSNFVHLFNNLKKSRESHLRI